MAEQYRLHVQNLETGEETFSDPFWTDGAAMDAAERLAEEYFGGDDVTWFETVRMGVVVGRILDDGTRSDVLVKMTILEEEVEEEDEPNDQHRHRGETA